MMRSPNPPATPLPESPDDVLRRSAVPWEEDSDAFVSCILPLFFFRLMADARSRAAYLPDEGARWRDVVASLVASPDAPLAETFAPALDALAAALSEHADLLDGLRAALRLPGPRLEGLIRSWSSGARTAWPETPEQAVDIFDRLALGWAKDRAEYAGEEPPLPGLTAGLLVEVLRPGRWETFYDPACGVGELLCAAVDQHIERFGSTHRLAGKIHGEEIDPARARIVRMRLLLRGVEEPRIAVADALAAPAFRDGDGLRRFSRVLSRPPFDRKQWDAVSWRRDPLRRGFAGTPEHSADWAYLQHMLRSLKPTGRLAAWMPAGVLTRTGIEGQIRRQVLRDDVLDAAIVFGPELWRRAPETALLSFHAGRDPQARRRVWVFDVFAAGIGSCPDPATADEILRRYRAREESAEVSRDVPLAEIAQREWALRPARYLAPPSTAEKLEVGTAVGRLRKRLAELAEAETKPVADDPKWADWAAGGERVASDWDRLLARLEERFAS